MNNISTYEGAKESLDVPLTPLIQSFLFRAVRKADSETRVRHELSQPAASLGLGSVENAGGYEQQGSKTRGSTRPGFIKGQRNLGPSHARSVGREARVMAVRSCASLAGTSSELRSCLDQPHRTQEQRRTMLPPK
jgi:hypothetical protein